MSRIEISRGVLIGLVATCAAAVLAMAFLLGRESSRPAPVPAPAAVVPDRPAAAPQAGAPPIDPAVPEPLPAPPPAGEPVRPRPAVPAAPVPPAAAGDPARAAVASYFQAIDQIQPGQLGGDPEAMAKGIVEDLGKGNTTGIDGMIRQSEAVRAKLAALATPAPCVAHHQESLGALDDSLRILRSVRNSMLGSSATGLPADFSSQANLLRDRTEKLQQEEKALRERYGLVR